VRVTPFPESYTRAVFADHAGSLHAVVLAGRPDKCSSTTGGSRAGGAEDVTAVAENHGMDVKNRVAVVTGAALGTGRSIALALAQAG
jgi:hypothetical protein